MRVCVFQSVSTVAAAAAVPLGASVLPASWRPQEGELLRRGVAGGWRLVTGGRGGYRLAGHRRRHRVICVLLALTYASSHTTR